ncbi:hypothetical protein AALO_G00172430 [Alosa alosa]|uniref:Zyxin n=1 Tax=Alosa alosa TaxID=278164 RepID=A0AAV6G6P1_9TELE|nr:hypothetical protein AALO_G00172430 [Alosa alosa]
MADSSSSKPLVVTSSVSLKVTAPSFYNQPKKFASVAPPRPRGQATSTVVSTGVIGRVGEMPPPPPSFCEDFPPPPPPLDDAELPAPPPEYDAPPPAFPAPPPPAVEDLPFPAPPEEVTSDPSDPSPPPPPPPPPPPLPASNSTNNNQPLAKSPAPATAPKSSFSPSQPASSTPKASNASAGSWGSSPSPAAFNAPKPAHSSSYPPPPPMAPPPPANVPSAPAVNHSKPSPIGSQENLSQPTAPALQPKPMPSLASSSSQPARSPAPPKSSGSGSGVGGVPLTMREVEELERLTHDFIKDMDTHAPVITSPPTEMCGKCGQALSRTQPAVKAMHKLFHSDCFCCMSCHRPLQGMQFYDKDGTPQCEDCYVNSLAMCSRCGERITDRVLKAVGQCFHAHCFRCTTCSCSLEGAPFITDDNNNPFCVPDYHRRFSPICVSCNEPIIPDPGSEETVRVVALEKNFHLKCYRCEDCARPLSIEADSDGCFPLDGRILCMKCHTQRAKQAGH